MTIERHVFIGGLHRSGTTLLEQLLVQAFDVSCLRMAVPENEGQHAQSVYSPARRFGGPGKFAFSAAMQEELESLGNHARCGEQIMRDWTPYIVGTSSILVEKSPPNLTKMPWLRKVFPGSKFIVIARDPRATSAATQKWSKTSLEELMMHWNVAYSVALEDSDPNDTFWVKYEELASQPGHVIEALGVFIEAQRRKESVGIAERFAQIDNRNDAYIAMHACRKYGIGAWDKLGYAV